MSAKPVSCIPQSPRLLDQLREVLRYKHYSLRTEEAYVYWVKFFVRWHGRNGQVRHPRELGAAEVEQFLSMLTTQRNVSVSTFNLALGRVSTNGTASPLDALAGLDSPGHSPKPATKELSFQ